MPSSMPSSVVAPPSSHDSDCGPGDTKSDDTISNLSKDGNRVRGSFDKVPDVYGLDDNIVFDTVQRIEVHVLCNVASLGAVKARLAEDVARRLPELASSLTSLASSHLPCFLLPHHIDAIMA